MIVVKLAFYSYIVSLIFAAISCRENHGHKLFEKLEASRSGISFSNDITENDSSNSFINEFGYMGGGVGIGDFNRDGLPDIFFTGNQVSCKLYVNKGNLKFEDVTDKAGLRTSAWCTGVSVADVNNDGWDDIYVSVFGKDLRTRSANLLFINKGNLEFTEQAFSYGLADTGYSTQAVFLDYDRDGDLDMYLANYLLSIRNGNDIFPRDNSGYSPANDRLYRNLGTSANSGHPVFKDVSIPAGIKEDGYGLGVSVSDFNGDGWPDIYTGNDFLSNDELWLNNRNGNFSNCINKALSHQSYSTMGTDAADINNDGLPDLVSLDMLPEYNERKKTSVSFMNYERYWSERALGYEPEFVRNMLQLNNGNRIYGDTITPFFSEIGELAGIDATDWSWSVLLADFNNDGWKDMHVTNGIGRDFINGDFLEFSQGIFNSNKSRNEQQEAIKEKLSSLSHVHLPNYLYINRHNLTFVNEASAAGVDEAAMSNGAAYADLDNDGDLDLVVNNINRKAFVFINNTVVASKPTTDHSIRIILEGDTLNRSAFGAKLYLYCDTVLQMQEQNPVRGYFSSVDQRILFGIGKRTQVDSLVIQWPDGKISVMNHPLTDSLIKISWRTGVEKKFIQQARDTIVLFSDITASSVISYMHKENQFNDFSIQRLLPQKYSHTGPFITTGDIDGDGTTDIFVGAAFNFPGKLFQQHGNGSFSAQNLSEGIKYEEDADCLFTDVDNDGDKDLIVTSGGMQYENNSPYYVPRLYLNNGVGSFTICKGGFPDSVRTIAGTISSCDFDNDGDMDLFIGGRVSTQYPNAPASFLLENKNGRYVDITEKVCPALKNIGMVTAAVWADIDNDKQADLVVAGEWMAIRFFKNTVGSLREIAAIDSLTSINGMWRSLCAVDMDNDGDIDLVAGNLGLNNDYRVSDSQPMELFSSDIDGNGSIDPVPFHYIKSQDGTRHRVPSISRRQLAEQVPSIKKQFLHYKDFVTATAEFIFKSKGLENTTRLWCNEMRTCYFENTGKGKFIKHPLPVEAQFAPVNAVLCYDFNKDGYQDILIAGNEYHAEVTRGRYDASYGCVLTGNGQHTFTVLPQSKSGFIVDGDVRDLALVETLHNGKMLLVGVNNDVMKVFQLRN